MEKDIVMGLEKMPEQIIDGVVDETLSSILVDVTELGLDKLLDESFLNDLPIIGGIFKAFKLTVKIKDRIFFTKMARFMLNFKDVPTEERSDFRDKISKDPKLKKKVGETIMLVLDRLDDIEKPDLLATAFKAYMAGRIDFADFRRLASAIDIALLEDLREFIKQTEQRGNIYKVNYNIKENLVRAGLFTYDVDVTVEVTTKIAKSDADTSTTVYYVTTSLGDLFLEIFKERKQIKA